MKKVIVPFVAIVVGFGLFAACSNDSDSANSQVSVGIPDDKISIWDKVSHTRREVSSS